MYEAHRQVTRPYPQCFASGVHPTEVHTELLLVSHEYIPGDYQATHPYTQCLCCHNGRRVTHTLAYIDVYEADLQTALTPTPSA
jgi:hypothetical protein